MSTKDQILSSALHGEALLTAKRPELQPLIDHLREAAQGRDDLRVECAGTIAGAWFASGARRWGSQWAELTPEHAHPGVVLWGWVECHLDRSRLPRRRVLVRFEYPTLSGPGHPWLAADRAWRR